MDFDTFHAERNGPALLGPALAAYGVPRDHTHWTRLGGGRSNLSWQVPSTDGPCVVKLFRPDRESVVFPNDPGSEARALTHLAGQDIAPALLHSWQSPLGPALAYHHLAGRTWQAGPAPVARLLRRVHALSPPAGLRQAADGSAALIAETRAQGGPGAEALLRHLPNRMVPPTGRRALLHGDPVAGNIVMTRLGPRLIDWQCPASGDPALDLATFLSPAMMLIYRGHPASPTEEERFLDAYGDADVVARFHVLRPFFHARMAGYCLSRAATGSPLDARAAEAEITALLRCC